MSDQTGDAPHDEQHSDVPAATVHGAKLLDTLERLFGRYLYLPDHAATLLALWVVHTHAINAAAHFPILLARSPEKGCGKTTLLRVLFALVRDPAMGAEFTAASLFRTIHARRPTILLDEGDLLLPNNRDLIRILNSGHVRGASIWKTETINGRYEPVEYTTWGPKTVAAIGSVMPPTTMDRCLVIYLQRKPAEVELIRFTDDQASALHLIRTDIAEWAAENEANLKAADAVTLVPFSNRRADNWRPLLTIADAASPQWGLKAREAASALAELQPEDPSESQMLLADMRTYFDQVSATHCPTQTFRLWLAKRDDRPWRDFHGYGKLISAGAIADFMRTYGIAPRKYRVSKDEVHRGYPLDAQLQRVFQVYAVEAPERVEQLERDNVVPVVPDVPHELKGAPTINLVTGRINR